MSDWLDKLTAATEKFLDTSKRRVQEYRIKKELSELDIALKEQILSKMANEVLEIIVRNEDVKSVRIKKYKKGKKDLWGLFSRDKLIRLLAKKLNLETILYYAKIFRIKTSDVIQDYEEERRKLLVRLLELKKDTEVEEFNLEKYESEYELHNILDEILELISEEFIPEPPITDERDLEKQLALF